eukprot:5630399-Pyramimonas_sp.AAC.1
MAASAMLTHVENMTLTAWMCGPPNRVRKRSSHHVPYLGLGAGDDTDPVLMIAPSFRRNQERGGEG